jgi:hypothetical protein
MYFPFIFPFGMGFFFLENLFLVHEKIYGKQATKLRGKDLEIGFGM